MVRFKFCTGLLATSLFITLLGGCKGTTSAAVDTGSVASGTASTQPSAESTMAMAPKDGTATEPKGMVKNGVFVAKDGKPLCPVQLEELATTKGAKFQIYKGVKYFFCCSGCPETFAKNPEKYSFKG